MSKRGKNHGNPGSFKATDNVPKILSDLRKTLVNFRGKLGEVDPGFTVIPSFRGDFRPSHWVKM